jgi:hypothetical protein
VLDRALCGRALRTFRPSAAGLERGRLEVCVGLRSFLYKHLCGRYLCQFFGSWFLRKFSRIHGIFTTASSVRDIGPANLCHYVSKPLPACEVWNLRNQMHPTSARPTPRNALGFNCSNFRSLGDLLDHYYYCGSLGAVALSRMPSASAGRTNAAGTRGGRWRHAHALRPGSRAGRLAGLSKARLCPGRALFWSPKLSRSFAIRFARSAATKT